MKIIGIHMPTIKITTDSLDYCSKTLFGIAPLRRVSVIRGRVVTPQGQGVVGVRTSVDKESKYGITATRLGGW